ncbi:hypothetical protein L202_07586 [Cryptococcus amylolentus CBS 6039]|uniref:ASTRA-associated protein 1 n=2 Tax=Cryptococcus amylolentus CBS 6039 TaxID=1295533 RepID=A0A1E3HCR4_9TREE|nr:hypothetical protein L202_07586 [Cryptococcus amylolentus CBS 6039]ODN74132.1 hypothetical protein L202_07586 [Cryptococcus amylolentus CBS 6039]
MPPAAPSPFHTLRTHSSPLATLHFSTSPSNGLLYSGDQEGWISVLDLRVRRVVAFWKAHEGGVLGLGEWEGGVVSHGRDNIILFHEPLKRPYIAIPTSTNLDPTAYGPKITNALPTNALNFCRFSLIQLSRNGTEGSKGKGKESEGLMAVPSLIDSELVDIYHVPSLKRLHASINLHSQPAPPPSGVDLPGTSKSGLVMSLNLFLPNPSSISTEEQVGLMITYESGHSAILSTPASSLSEVYDARMSKRPNPWDCRWMGKGHNEAIMAGTCDSRGRRGWTVSADHRLVRYEFDQVWDGILRKDNEDVVKPYATKQIGNSSIAVSGDDRVVAVGGWDGKVRLFSAATSKPLGTLSSHRDSVYALAFAHRPSSSPIPLLSEQDNLTQTAESTIVPLSVDASDEDDDDLDEDMDGVPPKERWMASGGKDGKVALWGLMDFGKASAGA